MSMSPFGGETWQRRLAVGTLRLMKSLRIARRAAYRAVIAATAAVLVTACGGGGDDAPAFSNDPCGVEAEKQFVLNTTREWYLFLELLPAQVQLSQFSTADALLDSLTATARAQNKDRFFSYIASIAEENQFFGAGQSVGFGISTTVRNNNTQLFITQAFETSAAADAGFARGDEVLAIGTSASTLEPIATILARPDGFSAAIGPADAGVTRTFRVRTNAGATVERTVTKRSYSLNPVPSPQLIQRTGLTPIGYVNLRTFVSTADSALRTAFNNFRTNNVRDVIIDLRYNGGGLVATAELLADLLSQGRSGQVQYQTRLNANKTSQQETVTFTNRAEAIPALRIAFLTSSASASASELVINSLAPYADVAIVGGRTSGKPVGQFAFDLSSTRCDARLRLVTFKSVNRDGAGDYFDGLPDAAYRDAFCTASDDLTRAQGNSAELMTSAALTWINTNACPVAAVTPGAAKLTARDEIGAPPEFARPTVAQINVPGSI
jgi:C-terminal processing protease CtpA/Prc